MQYDHLMTNQFVEFDRDTALPNLEWNLIALCELPTFCLGSLRVADIVQRQKFLDYLDRFAV